MSAQVTALVTEIAFRAGAVVIITGWVSTVLKLSFVRIIAPIMVCASREIAIAGWVTPEWTVRNL